MREIKFRCWNAHAGVMHEWEELIKLGKIHLLANQQGSYPVMQFTGMHDNCKKGLYEGDLCRPYVNTDLLYEVVWDEGSASFLYQLINGDMTQYEGMDEFDGAILIVGNIHQNKELLGE